ncbi:MAG: ribonuclease HII [Spirochaetes bacterium RBG_13_51_14]|nr:MAG: ribonuclease HII [Spirochaetes bacterium RBG_13_51_14]
MKKAGIESAFLLEPTFHIENHLIRKGYRVIAGIDETGRGALAGPLCVGVVIYDASFIASTDGAIPGINDSKKLTHRKRIAALDMITRISVHSSCILVSHRTIDRVNINGATEFALNRLLASISFRPDVVILDGNYSFRAPVPIYSIPKGDAKSISIASASIVAKVRRDMILDRLDKLYPGYNFSQNKGYGTEQHRQAIYNIGFSPIHRRSYEPVKSLARSIGHGE